MSNQHPYYGYIVPLGIDNLTKSSSVGDNAFCTIPEVLTPLQIHITSIELTFVGIAFLVCLTVIFSLYIAHNRLKKVVNSYEKRVQPQFNISSQAAFLILWVDEKGSLRYMNKEAAQITGLNHHHFQSPSIWDITENIRPDTWHETWNAITSKRFISFEETIAISGTDQKITFEQTYHFVQFKGTQFAMGYWQDISERKMEAKALIESEERYKTLVDQSPTPIALINNKRELIYLNSTAIQIFGLPDPAEVTGHDIMEVIHPDSVDLVLENLHNLSIGIGHEPTEIKLQRSDGKIFHTMTSSLPITLSGEPVALVVCHDITAYKKVMDALNENEIMLKQQNEEYITVNEQLLKSNQRIQYINLELMKAKDKAEKSDRLKTAFLANLSHEIRTPMNGILGFSELLLQPNLNQCKLESYIHLISQNSHKLLSIINDIVDISKIESGQIDISPIATNLNSLVQDLKLQMEGQMKDKRLSFSTHVDLSDSNAVIYTDDSRLRQVLLNLLSNALKFTPKGSVTFGYRIKNSWVEFFVSDTGIGIAPENHKLIFENFRQIEPEDRTIVSGTGLGLSISKAFVELLGGKIWLTSEFGQGATFHFTIPYNSLTLTESNSNETSTGRYNWTQKTILVADDEDSSFVNIEEILSVTYVQIIRANNGADAIEICNNHTEIDLVIIDLKLPLVNGVVASRMIKHMRPTVPIIALASHTLTEDKAEAMNAGCNDYIVKPIDKVELLKKIESQLNKNTISA